MQEVRLIDREATLKKMCETCGYCARFEKAMRSTHPDFVIVRCKYYKFLAEQPTIEAAPVRHGRWQKMGGDEPWLHGCCCSICGFTTAQDYNYCPNCGTRMDADHIADASKKVGGVNND